MKARRAWLIGAVVVVAAGIGIFVSARASRPTPVQYDTVRIDQGRIVARVTATGKDHMAVATHAKNSSGTDQTLSRHG